MKKIMFAAVSALALSALADGVSSTQFGAMTVSSTDKRTLVAIPWDNTVAGGGDIAVSNLVLTANLTAGDTLHVLSTNGYSLCHWTLTAGTGGVLYWKAPDNDVKDGDGDGIATVTAGTASDVATIKRGSSVILIRQSFTNSVGVAIPFYVMGQVASTGSSTTITAGTSDDPIYNMIAPPSTEPQSLNDSTKGAKWEGTISSNDRIYIPHSPLNIELKYVDNLWKNRQTVTTNEYYLVTYNDKGKITGATPIDEEDIPELGKGSVVITNQTSSTTWAEYKGTIPVGTGFWYLSKGGSPTVTWQDEAITTK